MASASSWVQQIVSSSLENPMTTEDVLNSLERHVGQGEQMLTKVQAVMDCIDNQLIERRGGQVMRDLWATVADYYEKVQEARAAA